MSLIVIDWDDGFFQSLNRGRSIQKFRDELSIMKVRAAISGDSQDFKYWNFESYMVLDRETFFSSGGQRPVDLQAYRLRILH